MRKLLAIMLCRLCHFVGKHLGRGSSLPGKLALAVCPDILGRLQLPGQVIAVTGSGGKSSTVEMAAALCRAAGLAVICNEEGSNQIEGIATLVLSHATLAGRVKAQVLLMEVDERYTASVFSYIRPARLVVTNLCRDQLTRNGHPEEVYASIHAAIWPETELLLNGDDPLSSCLARGRGRVRWFGVDRCGISGDHPMGVYHDGAYCPVSKEPMEYTYVNYSHMGGYRCMYCGHARPRPDYAVVDVDLAGGSLVLEGDIRIHLSHSGISHVYNVLAAWAIGCSLGIPGREAARILDGYRLQNGRIQSFTLGRHHGKLLVSKHENSVAYDTSLQYIAADKEDCTVLVIVDAVSRKYPTCETSWLWDVDFGLLRVPHVKRILLSGRYCRDLAERFLLLGLAGWSIQPDIAAAAADIRGQGEEKVYVVTCFSDKDKFLACLEVPRGGCSVPDKRGKLWKYA